MRNFFTILLLLLSTASFSAIHYVNAGGGGDFTTIAQVNAHTFVAGDIILFNRGDVWRETLTVGQSGNSGAWITYGVYGTGAKPMILGSNISTWSASGTANVWQCNISVTDPTAIGGSSFGSDLWFDNAGTITQGLKKTYSAGFTNLTAEYNWTYNSSKVYVYATSDPDARYTSVEIPQREYGIQINQKQFIEIDGLDVRYYCRMGIYSGTYTTTTNYSYLTVQNCYVAYSGLITPGVQNDRDNIGINTVYSHLLLKNNIVHDNGRRNISLYNYGSGFTVTDITIEDNTLYKSYHTTGIDIMCGNNSTTSDYDGIVIRNNLIYEDESSFNYTCEGINVESYYNAAVKIKNISIYNNVIKFPQNSGVHLYGVENAYLYHNTFYGHCANTPNGNVVHIKFTGLPSTGVVIKNNIFYTLKSNTSNSVGNGIYTYPSQPDAGITADGNVYYRIASACVIIELRDGAVTHHYNDIANVRSVTGWEITGQTADPLFVSSSDYHLQSNSPAIENGVYLSGAVPIDRDGKTRPNPPSAGAYEYEEADPPAENTYKHSIMLLR